MGGRRVALVIQRGYLPPCCAQRLEFFSARSSGCFLVAALRTRERLVNTVTSPHISCPLPATPDSKHFLPRTFLPRETGPMLGLNSILGCFTQGLALVLFFLLNFL